MKDEVKKSHVTKYVLNTLKVTLYITVLFELIWNLRIQQ